MISPITGGCESLRNTAPSMRAATRITTSPSRIWAIVLGRDVVLNTGCPQLEAGLQSLGYRTHSTDLSEFIKAGGSAKCLTLRLDGEDAAEWP